MPSLTASGSPWRLSAVPGDDDRRTARADPPRRRLCGLPVHARGRLRDEHGIAHGHDT